MTTFTFRNVTAGQRDAQGEMILTHLGNVTLTLKGMSRAEVAEWEWATDALNTRGINEALFRLTVNGWKVVHPESGVVGLLFQGAGTRVHVEYYDPEASDYFSAGYAAKLRHGAAQVIYARQRAGLGIPADVEPEPVKTPADSMWLRNGTPVRYHGTFAAQFGDLRIRDFRAYECGYSNCEHCPCGGYELWTSVLDAIAVHVRPDSVSALEPSAA